MQSIVPDVRSETSVSHCDLGAMLLPSCYPGSCNANDTLACLAWAGSGSKPRARLQCKSAVYGLNGHRASCIISLSPYLVSRP